MWTKENQGKTQMQVKTTWLECRQHSWVRIAQNVPSIMLEAFSQKYQVTVSFIWELRWVRMGVENTLPSLGSKAGIEIPLSSGLHLHMSPRTPDQALPHVIWSLP